MNWDERRPLLHALAERKPKARAARMLAVLKDGQKHSRRELHERGGFYLTNNAAAELRVLLEPHELTVRRSTERVNGETIHSYQLASLEEPLTSVDGNDPIAHGDAGRGSSSDADSQLALLPSDSVYRKDAAA